jgi:hypothetical protein
MTAPQERSDISDQRDSQDSTDPAESAEPIEKAEPNDPMLPIDNAEPTLPMDSTEPREPMDSTESVDHRERREEPVAGMSASWRRRPSSARRQPDVAGRGCSLPGVTPFRGALQPGARRTDAGPSGIGTEVTRRWHWH